MTVRWWTAVVAAASMLAVHNCEVKSENAVAEEHNGMQQMELVDMLMYNKECAKKVWPVMYKAIVSAGAVKKNPEKRSALLTGLAERAMAELDGIGELGCTASSFDALLTASYYMGNDIGNSRAAYNLYSAATQILKGNEDQLPPKKVAIIFGAMGSLETRLAASLLEKTQPNPDLKKPWGALSDNEEAERLDLRQRSEINLKKALSYEPESIEYRQSLAQVLFDADDKKAESKQLYLSLLADKDLMDTNSQFKLYQNLRYFALFERNLVEAEMYTDELESQFPWHNGPLVKAFLELSREVLSNTDTGQTAEVLKHAEKLLRKAVVYSKKRNDSNRSTLNELAAILKRVLLKRAMMDKVLVQYPRPQSANTTATPTMRRTGGWESGGRDVDTAQVGHVDYLDPADFTNMDEFYTAYLGWNRPVIIGKGLMEEWPAMTEWTRDKLSRPGPRSDIEVITGKTPYPKKMGFPVIKTSIWEFIDKNMGNESERALRFEEGGGHFLYMFQEMHTAKEAEASRKLMEEETPKEYVQSDEGNTMEKGGAETEMLKAIESQRTSEGLLQNWTTLMSDYEFPPHFSFPTSLRWMRDKVPPPVKHFFVGPRGSGTHAHAHQNAFNALIYGRKRWILIPPEYNLATVDEGDMQKNAPIRGFLKNVLPQLIKQKIDYIDIIQEPGEFIFVPDMWTHAIYNLEDSVGVAYQIGRPTKEWNYEMLEEDYPMNFVPKKQ